MRLFVALTPPDGVLDRLETLQSEIPCGRLVIRENLHLTLAFAGEVTEHDAESLHDALSLIEADPFAVTLGGLGTFGHPNPSVLWIGAEGGASLDALHRKVRGALHSSGIMPDRQRFRPHITLTRFGQRIAPDEAERLARFLSIWGATALPPFVATRFSLFQSHLSREGSRYDLLADYPLGPDLEPASE